MHDAPSIEIVTGDWAQLGLDAARIRDAVFIREQGIPAELEWDADDATSVHVVAYRVSPAREPVATARLLPGGWIGRVAVIKSARRGGLGMRLVEALVEAARVRGDDAARLYAQTYVTPLYEKCGFSVVGEEFEEAGIPHIQMVRRLRAGEADKSAASPAASE
jgi:predicted GNAT family N-acyltransferase